MSLCTCCDSILPHFIANIYQRKNYADDTDYFRRMPQLSLFRFANLRRFLVIQTGNEPSSKWLQVYPTLAGQ